MSGQAMTAVGTQINTINGYAQSAFAAAQSALSSLVAIDLPTSYASSYSVGGDAVSTPTSPSLPSAMAITTAPDIVSITVPAKVTKPDIDTVTLGSLLAISLPNVPTVSFPALNVEAPIYSITQPTEWAFGVNSNILISDDPMIQAAINRLSDNIANGGTGLSADVEAAIWARGLEREGQQLEDSSDNIISLWAKRGFSLPDGMLAHSLSEIQKEYMNKKIDRSREIEIKQAELEQANLFKSLELSISLAKELIGLLISYEELVFKGQEATARFANEYIDLQIKTYMSMVEAYKATAQVQEILIRSEIAKVELYKAQLDGQRLIGEINQQTVKVYSEQLQATTILIERYKTEVQAMVSELEVEKTKIEANKIQMDLWAKRADVEIARYNGAVELYKATSMFNVATAELQSKGTEANMRTTIAAVEANVRSFQVQETSMVAKAQIIMEAARGVAITAGSMAAGAMAAASAHSSMSYSESMELDESV
jgi:hypothetical protein